MLSLHYIPNASARNLVRTTSDTIALLVKGVNNPFFAKKKVSLRIRNFESGRLKVNELDGSPIEIGAVIVWQVADSAEAVYNVDDYESFVHIQSEAALRAMASSYPFVDKISFQTL